MADTSGRFTPTYMKWRKSVIKRDGETCVLCNSQRLLHAHHIKRWADAKQGRLSIDNGVTLCCDCHERIHGGSGEKPSPDITTHLKNYIESVNKNGLRDVTDLVCTNAYQLLARTFIKVPLRLLDYKWGFSVEELKLISRLFLVKSMKEQPTLVLSINKDILCKELRIKSPKDIKAIITKLSTHSFIGLKKKDKPIPLIDNKQTVVTSEDIILHGSPELKALIHSEQAFTYYDPNSLFTLYDPMDIKLYLLIRPYVRNYKVRKTLKELSLFLGCSEDFVVYYAFVSTLSVDRRTDISVTVDLWKTKTKEGFIFKFSGWAVLKDFEETPNLKNENLS